MDLLSVFNNLEKTTKNIITAQQKKTMTPNQLANLAVLGPVGTKILSLPVLGWILSNILKLPKTVVMVMKIVGWILGVGAILLTILGIILLVLHLIGAAKKKRKRAVAGMG